MNLLIQILFTKQNDFTYNTFQIFLGAHGGPVPLPRQRGGGQGQGQGQTTTKNLLDNDLTLLLPKLFQVIIMHLIRYRLIPVIPP